MDVMSIEQARSDVSGRLAPLVLEYILRFKRVIEESKARTIEVADMASVAELLDTENFERIGGPGDSIRWPRYSQAQVGFANSSLWEGRFRRITEVPGRVYLELEERGSRRDGSEAFLVNSVTIYEFNKDDKLERLWVYLQHPNEWG